MRNKVIERDNLELRVRGKVISGLVKKFDEWPVWFSVSKIFPPMRHQNCHSVAVHVLNDGFKHRAVATLIRKQTARM